MTGAASGIGRATDWDLQRAAMVAIRDITAVDETANAITAAGVTGAAGDDGCDGAHA